METNNYIAQVRIDNCATVRVLKITPNVEITCDRKCACLKESRNGSVQCSIGWIKKMVNFKTSALFIDYEVILDRNADWDWPVCASNFHVIDEEGNLFKGEFLCDSIVSPERIANSPDTLFPGTKGKYRVYYETFPKDGKVASIMAVRIGNIQGRMDLMSAEPIQQEAEVEPRPQVVAPEQTENLRERVETLEKEMRKIRADFDILRLTLAGKGLISYKHKDRVMTDPGIEYHPLDNK